VLPGLLRENHRDEGIHRGEAGGCGAFQARRRRRVWSFGAADRFEPLISEPFEPAPCTRPDVLLALSRRNGLITKRTRTSTVHAGRACWPNASPPDNRLTRTGVAVMRKAVLTAAGGLFAAGATGVFGMAMLATPTAAWASSGGCTQSSPCTLAFTTDGQPAGTTVNTTITSSFDSPGAGPVKVEVVDQFGNTVANAKANITIAITSTANPGNGTLSGSKTVNTSNGVASFSNLSIDQPGVGYRLTATSRGLGSVTSLHFTIWSSIQPCPTTPCSASTPPATTSGTVTTSSAGSTQFLGTGIGGGTYSCATYQPVSDPFTFDVVSGTGDTQPGAQFTAVLRIDKSLVQSSGHPGASTWQICYASMTSFTPRPGTSLGSVTIGDVPYVTGLLPDCSNTTPMAPCVQARNKDNAGDVLVTFLASGDPIGRG
jgi:hypothetical protein